MPALSLWGALGAPGGAGRGGHRCGSSAPGPSLWSLRCGQIRDFCVSVFCLVSQTAFSLPGGSPGPRHFRVGVRSPGPQDGVLALGPWGAALCRAPAVAVRPAPGPHLLLSAVTGKGRWPSRGQGPGACPGQAPPGSRGHRDTAEPPEVGLGLATWAGQSRSSRGLCPDSQPRGSGEGGASCSSGWTPAWPRPGQLCLGAAATTGPCPPVWSCPLGPTAPSAQTP